MVKLGSELVGLGDAAEWAHVDGKQIKELVTELLRAWLAEAPEERHLAIIDEGEAICRRVLR